MYWFFVFGKHDQYVLFWFWFTKRDASYGLHKLHATKRVGKTYDYLPVI